MGRGGCVRSVDCRYCGYDAVMPYLKLKPDTYILQKHQVFKFDTCQFCGSKAGHDFQRLQSMQFERQGITWKRTCKSCRKTTAIVKKDGFID